MSLSDCGICGAVVTVGDVGGETLAETLVLGNITGGTDIDYTVGDAANFLGEIDIQRDGVTFFGSLNATTATIDVANLQFLTGVVAPTISQADETGAVDADALTIQAQNNTNAGVFDGGDLNLGTGSSTGGVEGFVNLQSGGTTFVTFVNLNGGAQVSQALGDMRVPHDWRLAGRNNADGGDVSFLEWGAGAANRLTFNCGVGGTLLFSVNGSTVFLGTGTQFQMHVATLIFRDSVGNAFISIDGTGDDTGNDMAITAQDNNSANPAGDLFLDAGRNLGAGAQGSVALRTGDAANVVEINGTAAAPTLGFFAQGPVARAAAFTRNAVVSEDHTLLASASATILNNNNVIAAMIDELQLYGLFQGT